MIKLIFKSIILICLLAGMPLAGAALTGHSVSDYLRFPPVTKYVHHAGFSWIHFTVLFLIIISVLIPFLNIFVKSLRQNPLHLSWNSKMPWWGKLGLILLIFFWLIAWTKIDFLMDFRGRSFFPLWISYIILINSLQYSRTGKCIMLNNTGKFLLLFPISAIFWWYFEYLNVFVNNWYYEINNTDNITYFILSSFSFSTVLPAVISTNDFIDSYFINGQFEHLWPVEITAPRITAVIVLIISSAGLLCIGIFPEYLFVLLWLSPLLIIVSIQTLFNERHILSDIKYGNWNTVVSAALAALFCGIFWEMWNYFSFPRWQYSIPFVQRFKIFEMPVIGYSGYLPFGLLCVSISNFFNKERY